MRRSQVRILIGSLRSQVLEVSLFLGKNKVELQWQVMVVLQQLSSGCGAVGSASGLGPEGRTFESCYPDRVT